MNYTIIEIIHQDPDYLVRVALNESSTIFLNFNHIPSQEEVNRIVESFLEENNGV